MSPLTNEAAGTIFREVGAWFGPPALLRKHPAQFTLDPQRLCDELTHIIDGRIRFSAIVLQKLAQGRLWLTGEIPFLVYPCEDIYSTDGRKLLPRMLTLAGHYDRAARHLPEHWSATAPDVAAFLGVTSLEANLVFVEVRVDQKRRRAKQAHPYTHDNLRIVDRIRSGLAARAMGESDFGLREIARLVEFTGPVV